MRAPLLLVLLAGCSDYEVKGQEKEPPAIEESPGPHIRVDPLVLDFGVASTGTTSDARIVTISNVGDAALGIDSVSLVDASMPFSVTRPQSVLLPPDATTNFLVTFSPYQAGVVAGEIEIASNDPDEPIVVVTLSGEAQAPEITLEPEFWDFGTLEYAATSSIDVTVRNDGEADLHVTDILYTSLGSELTMRPVSGALTLAAGESTVVTVDYAPTDDSPDEGYVTVYSDDPDEPQALANQIGNARIWEGFSTGWYIVDDATNYETTSNPSYSIGSYGDPDGYWYEPSGAHGMIASADVATDWATLHDYVIARAGAPTPVTAPLTFRSASTVPAFTYASYSYILCDFWIDATDNLDLYEVRAGSDDDGAQVIVNGQIVANWYLGPAGSVNIGSAIVPGAVNSLIVILMDNSAVDKYLTDLAFYRDGVFVSG